MSLFFTMCVFFLGCLIYCHVQFVACTFVTCSNKDQSINQSSGRENTSSILVDHGVKIIVGCYRNVMLL